jgi:hypothetical protein
MNTKQLLNIFSDREILNKLFSLYPKEKKNKKGYLIALKELRVTEPIKSVWSIRLTPTTDFDGKPYVMADMVNKKGTEYSLSFIKWAKILGMKISPSKRTCIDAISHILYEITFYGYTMKDTQTNEDKIFKEVKKFEAKLKDKSKKPKAEEDPLTLY